jgi:hypothetical protein
VNVGEKIYTAFNKYTSADDYSHPEVYFGEVGKLNKAKKVGTSGSHRMIEFARVNGKFTIVSESENNGKYIVQIRKLTGKKWSSPKRILVDSNDYGVSPWETGCEAAPKFLICSAPVFSQAFDPENGQDAVGLNVEIIK